MKFDARAFLEGLFAEPAAGCGNGDPRANLEALGLIPAVALSETPLGYLAPADLSVYWREFYEERAAIREYDGNQPREHAEAEAWSETLAAMREAGEIR